jgi:hypothetical protein
MSGSVLTGWRLLVVRHRREPDDARASRLEVLGAWLGLWTPPRDVVVPPVPWPKVAAGVAGLLVVAALVALFVAPAIDEAKDERAAREQRERAAQTAASRAAQRDEQRARTGRAGGGRAAVLTAVEDAIGDDARARFDPDARHATCEPVAGADATAAKVAYACHSAIRDIVGAGDQEGASGVLAIPFRAVIDFERGTYAFCKVNPPPGEQAIPDPRDVVRLPEACRVPHA